MHENAILQVSYIGYLTQEIKISNQTHLKIIMKEDSETLDEVVVIGYGVVKKKDLTGSVGQISSAFARTTQSDAVLGEQGQSRFQILRFLVEVYVLIVIPAVILHMALKRFGSHMIMLWQNIKYIHLVDGKKAKHFPVIK